MANYFELDFLEVHSSKSGDAITIRYEVGGETFIHVVDGGYVATGEKIVEHINNHYGPLSYIDHVVATHNDGDHACGLRVVLESFPVGTLWLLRPWLYAEELLPRFATYNSVDRLRSRLRSIYSNLAALEEIAEERGINIQEPFQGSQIGAFTVLAPTRTRFLDLVVASDKTPEAAEPAERGVLEEIATAAEGYIKKAINLIRAAWGAEVFSTDETSAENEMSVVQYANICDKKILLTGDTGRGGLAEAADYAPTAGLFLPGITYFQVPHHGSRRNVSTELLDRWLGQRLDTPVPKGSEKFTAIISAASEDEDHPRKAVVRACMHRGARVVSTDDGKGQKIFYANIPLRKGWVVATPLDYPTDQEA
ncbi:competence protein ComEC (plasmid) [Azospirillum oryzae]|uniref:Competence protein ComEC n=1 Tax=Azospirillum oryzae TaxID=286727 RepID=A0A6N1AIF3_9PROT|nr:MBL fold metallo-hydrolase [Azospirillum oryzae]KAA0588801.1 competence protein ComEC [Azospirillum oryzae]QKS50147.1 competence protein ComEC [Azospirillum oryzae]GLR80290.1 hypothetical protein GCM10007856_29680 [Azospirillum oryzae]